MLITPREISIKDLTEKRSLSARNFATINISNPNKVPLSTLLDSIEPYTLGEEPGSIAYVKRSPISFLRNSCIDQENFSNQESKEVFLNPNYTYGCSLRDGDILLCKDANIGDACVFLEGNQRKYVFSSGVVRLNISDEKFKYYCLAMLRDDYFRHQLDAATPRGSTIRHSGDKFLECFLPAPDPDVENLLPIIDALCLNLAHAERVCAQKQEASNQLLRSELFSSELPLQEHSSFSELNSTLRFDSGYFSRTVREAQAACQNYKHGSSTLSELGFSLKRGPNLAKRDLGRSVQSSTFRKGMHILVYPSDISESGYLLRETFLGARNPVWFMKRGDVLFSAEGTVGRTFVICDESLRFTTNFHGLIISPSESLHLSDSVALGQYLHFLRTIGYFEKVSVGGQGGSFASSYWVNFYVPKFSEDFKEALSKLYHSPCALNPFHFDLSLLSSAGLFQLNAFRIACQTCLSKIVGDIKSGDIKKRGRYVDDYWNTFKSD